MLNLMRLKDGEQPEDDFWSMKFLQGSKTSKLMLSASEGWRREYDLGDNELKMSWGLSN